VFAATQEQFVPQMINFEVLGGVDFRKGCYPGQEVVARSQYRSALRRRLGVAHADSARVAQDVLLAAGPGGADQPVGSVVMAASAPDGGMDLLFESTAAAGEALRSAGQDLTVRQLPYPIVDATA
jgi:folate-binding protein YgfZ